MRFDLLRRLRWGNVAFTVAALVAAISVVEAALDPAPPPRLPSDRAAPLIAGEARPRMAAKPPVPAKSPAQEPTRRARRAAPPRRVRRRPARRRERQRPAPAPARRPVARRTQAQPPRPAKVVPPPAVASPVRSPSAPTAAKPGRGEFGFEGG